MKSLAHSSPKRPLVLEVLKALRSRFVFSDKDKAIYVSARRGFEGELRFANFLKKASPHQSLILHSLSLESNHSKFQIDTLLFNNHSIYLFEVKNFAGDYYIRKNNWFLRKGDQEINNPFIQLKRSESLLRQLLSSLGVPHKIIPYVVFIHPEFTLFNAPMNLPLIFHSQLKRFFHQDFFQPFPISDDDQAFARLIVQEHKEDLRLDQLPKYTFESLRKGVKCASCGRFMEVRSKKSLWCQACNLLENNEPAILRTIEEYVTLFPNRKITTRELTKWCYYFSDTTIRRVLRKNFTKKGIGRSIYYVKS